ncbi:phosphatase PAP2 family protein [Blastococcus brunescens]|uniref:phosphatase PAP2 family protein n=1 Tax=Blastococcus brunescens TaxID=1564165 RepID=UPI003BEF3B70
MARSRPDLAEPVSYASGFAFPSGHTMGSAIGVSVLLLVFLPVMAPSWRRPAVAVGTLFAVAVGLSRVVLGVHWASDVLGAWLLSLIWVLAMMAVFRTWHRQEQAATSATAHCVPRPGPEVHEPPSTDPNRGAA